MTNKMEYHLVLEYLPGDFMPIDINILLNNDQIKYDSLDMIDSFTKQYTTEEIINMVREYNLVPEYYLNGVLQIINNRKYRYKVISRDTNFSLDLFFSKNITNKRLMNKFFNIYLKYDNENKEAMQKAIESSNIYEVLNLIFSLPYENVRNIYTYMEENLA